MVPTQLANQAQPPAEGEGLLLVVRIGSVEYAVPAAEVERILPMAALTALPETATDIAGLLDLHGEVLPVVDPRARLGPSHGREPAQQQPEQHLLLVTARSRYLLWVDRAERVVQSHPEDWLSVSETAASQLTPYVARLGQDVLPVLSTAELDPGHVTAAAPPPARGDA